MKRISGIDSPQVGFESECGEWEWSVDAKFANGKTRVQELYGQGGQQTQVLVLHFGPELHQGYCQEQWPREEVARSG